MALEDDAVLSVGTGHFYKNAVGTAAPTTAAALVALATDPGTTGWEQLGHTSLEDILSVASEGGEPTVLGTLQAKNLRTSYSARTETLAITLQQADAAGLKLYYGANMAPISTGSIWSGVPSDPDPTEAAFLAVFQDGAQVFAFYAPKAEIFRNDDLEVADTESLLGLPLGVKPLTHSTNTWTYAVTPLVPLA